MQKRHKETQLVAGAKFKASTFFRPTGMSVAMSKSSIIPGVHLVRDFSKTCLLRHKDDRFNARPSVNVAF